MNKFSNSRQLFEIFNIHTEVYKVQKTNEEGEQVVEPNKLKKGMMKRLNDHINPVLCDMHPDECVEEAYKHKNNQMFSWKFLRAAICMIPIGKLTLEHRKSLMLRSEIEDIAQILHEQALKRPVVLEENGDGENNGDDDFAKFMMQQSNSNGGDKPKEPNSNTESKTIEDATMKEEYAEPAA